MPLPICTTHFVFWQICHTFTKAADYRSFSQEDFLYALRCSQISSAINQYWPNYNHQNDSNILNLRHMLFFFTVVHPFFWLNHIHKYCDVSEMSFFTSIFNSFSLIILWINTNVHTLSLIGLYFYYTVSFQAQTTLKDTIRSY